MRGLCPRAPGIYRFPARMAAGRGGFAPPAIPALDRRSGRVPALPYPPSRPRQYTPPSGSIVKNVCRNVHRWVINTLVLVQFRWPVLKCPRMAGFQVSTEDVALGENVIIEMPKGELTYVVTATRVVDPSETLIMRPTSDSRITLITCYPFDFFGHAPRRFVVTGRLLTR